MIIAPHFAATNYSAAAQSAAPAPAKPLEYRRGDVLPGAGISSTVREFLRVYGNDVLSLPGAYMVSWFPTQDDALTVHYRTDDQRAVADSVLEPALNGVKLLSASIEDGKSAPLPPLATAERFVDCFAAVAALTGVWDARIGPGGWAVDGNIIFDTTTDKVTARLNPLIRDRFFGQHRDDGTDRYYDVSWNTRPVGPGVTA
ncbi:MAG: hypothetical protein H7123_02375 [Thermoleophilia bacterium]|nr:hypothetical protein [Thermoleophilia bacterium]